MRQNEVYFINLFEWLFKINPTIFNMKKYKNFTNFRGGKALIWANLKKIL